MRNKLIGNGCPALVAVLLTGAMAHAAPGGGVVTGTVGIPQLGLGEAPPRNVGFIERMEHPLKEPEAFNPRREMVVVLEGGQVAGEDKTPPRAPVVYRLVGESFETPVLPVVTGSRVLLKNQTKNIPDLYSPTNESLIKPKDRIFNPTQTAEINGLDQPLTLYEIRSRDSAHFRALILTLPHAYFSTVDTNGKFEIRDVPAGTWRVRVWYQGGWLKTNLVKVGVRSKSVSSVTVHLPQKLKVDKPEGEK